MTASSPARPAPADALPDAAHAAHLRTARRVFRGCLYFAIAMTLAWLYFVITQRDGGLIFDRYSINRQALLGIAAQFVVGWFIWGSIWWGIRWLLLRRVAGFSREELKVVFSSRLNQPFELSGFLARHSERRIRIIDMIGRRGRYITLGLLFFILIFQGIGRNPTPQHFITALQQGLIDSIFFSWLVLAAYYSDSWFGRAVLGAQTRLMDGVLGRANCVLIMMLWHAFRFIMVPIGLQLTAHFPPQTYAAVFAFIWLSYQVSDTLSEVVGSLIGKQKLRVWGLGDVNRKSVAGTWGCFLGSLVVCLWVIWLQGLPAPWLALAVVVSLSNTVFELFSPRGTDDFAMATANALLCWGFGVLVY